MSDKKSVEALEQELLDSQVALETANKLAAELTESNEALTIENAALKEELAALVKDAPVEKEKSAVGECFEFGGEKYKVLSSSIRIPNIGKKTALEILTDEKAQEWLVTNNSGAIKKMF